MMTINNITEISNISDTAILYEIGNSIKQTRLKKNITQDELAKLSGLDRTTISQLENGRAVTLLTLVRVLRSLDKLDKLNNFFNEPDVSPLAAVKLKKQTRKRASGKKSNSESNKESEW